MQIWSSPEAHAIALTSIFNELKARLAPLPLDLGRSAGAKERAWVDAALLGIRPGEAVELLLTQAEAEAVESSLADCQCVSLAWTHTEPVPKLRQVRVEAKAPQLPEGHKALQGSCSVVVPTYNPEPAELRRCLASIDRALDSIEGSHEILLVDDASRKSVKDQLEADFRASLRVPLRVSSNKQNLGPGVTRNRGVAAAQGDYVFFVDSDNEVFENYFRFLIPELAGGRALVGCSMLYADSTPGERRVFCAGPLTVEALFTANRCDVGVGLSRRHPAIQQIFAAKQPLFPQQRMHHFEDWEMLLFLTLLDVQRAIVPIPLYRYYRNAGGRNLQNPEYQFSSEVQALISAMERALAIDPARVSKQTLPLLATLRTRVLEHEEARLTKLKALYKIQNVVRRLQPGPE